MQEFKHVFFGREISGRVSNLNDSLSQVSFVDSNTNDAWVRVFNYDHQVRILEADENKLSELVNYYKLRSMKGSSVLLAIAQLIIQFVSTIERLFRAFLGSFFGFGLLGIMLVAILLLASAVMSIYAFIVMVPFLLISFSLKWHFSRKIKMEINSLKNATMEQLA